MASLRWTCYVCTLQNASDRRYCAACYAIHPDHRVVHPPEDDYLFGGMVDGLPGEWTCPRCTYINSEMGECCNMCGKRRLGEYSHGGGHFEGGLQTDSDQPSSGPYFRSLSGYVTEESSSSFLNEEMRIVLIGRTGSGKSATGNSILGEDLFHSRAGGCSVTKHCKRGHASRLGRQIQVVDSPGLYDTGMTNAQITKEIVKCIGMTSPGPHAIILVTRIDRFTQEEQDTVKHFREVFGDGMMKYLFVLFTRKDDLDAEGTDIHMYVENVPPMLKQLLSDCNKRYIAFNNRLSRTEKDDQVRQLLDSIELNIRSQGGRHYTSDMYREAEEAMLRRELAIKEQMEEDRKRERREIEREFQERHAERNREQQYLIEQLQCRLIQLDAEQTTGKPQSEVAELKKQISLMTKEAEAESERRRLEHEERMRKLEEETHEVRKHAREKARVQVEEEEESSLGEIWTGIKKVGRGIWRGITSLFS